MDTKKTHVLCFVRVKLRTHNMYTILGSIANIFGEPMWPFKEHKNVHAGNEEDHSRAQFGFR